MIGLVVVLVIVCVWRAWGGGGGGGVRFQLPPLQGEALLNIAPR